MMKIPVASHVIWNVPAVVETSAPKFTKKISGLVDAVPVLL
jgi:hypothetical protein